MITIYEGNTTNFNNNGITILNDCISCNIIEELNGQYELELEYPLDERGKWQYLLENNIIKADGQLFRIYNKTKSLDSIKVNARHIFYDLLDNFVESVSLYNTTGANALYAVLNNTQYEHKFSSTSDINGSYTTMYVYQNPVEAIMGNNGIINIWGGGLERDNFTIRYKTAIGQDRGVLVSYGKNIIGIEETLDVDGVCTRLLPIGKDGLTLSEKYIDSQYINNYPHPKIRMVEFSDAETESALRTIAQQYMSFNNIDIPSANYKVDFIELSKTEEYKNYSVLETVYLGDTVTIRHSKLNINLKAKVIKTVKNVITGRTEKIELGSFKVNLATSINNSIQTVKQEIVTAKSNLQTAIDNATTQINSALGGYVVKRNGELLIMDTEDINTATKVWRWNQNGLGYSSTGYNGQFATAITSSGSIVADFITTGVLDAAIVKTGTLTSEDSTITVNLDNNTLHIGNKLIFDGVNLTLGTGVTLNWSQINGASSAVTTITNDTLSTTNVTAQNLKVNSANINGTLTADKIVGGTLSGVTFKTSSSISDSRTEIVPSGYYAEIKQYDTDNTNRLTIRTDDNGGSIRFYNDDGILVNNISLNYDGLLINASNGNKIYIGNPSATTKTYGIFDTSGSTTVKLGGSSSAIGFFGKDAIAKQSAALLSGSETLTQVIAKVNGIMNQLANYGLINVS